MTLEGFEEISSLDGITLGIDWKYFKVFSRSSSQYTFELFVGDSYTYLVCFLGFFAYVRLI